MQTEAAIARHPERSKAESNCEATTSLGAVGISRGRQINLAQILRGGVFLVVILERSEESREKTPCSRMTPKGVGRGLPSEEESIGFTSSASFLGTFPKGEG